MFFSRPSRSRVTAFLRRIFSWLAFATLLTQRMPAQTTVSVPATANIYGAGFGSPPGPNGGGGGVLPTLFNVSGGTTTLTITGVSGSVTFDNITPVAPNAADGGTSYSALTQLSSYNSLSGITYTGRTVFLVGVFLNASAPSGTAPATLSYNDTSAGGSSFSPVLQQVFFVGDGLDANAAIQTFSVPTGATRFYLGFADSWNGSSVTGPPGDYSDNGGSLNVTITAIPEPATGSLLLGFGALGAVWLRRSPLKR
jgi:hypothetical protein